MGRFFKNKSYIPDVLDDHMQEESEPPPPQDDGRPIPRYQGFHMRLWAATIDMVILTLIFVPFMDFGGDTQMVTPAMNQAFADLQNALITQEEYSKIMISEVFAANRPAGGWVLHTLLSSLVLMGVGALFWASRGATPGKMLLGMKIVDERSLEPIGWKQSLLRTLGYLISTVTLGLGFFAIGFSDKKRGWHDKIAGTVVVKFIRPQTKEEKEAAEKRKFRRQSIIFGIVTLLALLYLVRKMQ